MKKVYITGASGVLGAGFAEYFDRLPDYSPVAVSRRPCPLLPDGNKAQRQVSNIFDASWLDAGDTGATVLHCAGLSQPRAQFKNFDVLAREHILPHIAMVEAMLERGWRGRLIFLSSGGTVYGNPLEIPIPETHPTSPVSFYGLHKLRLERAFSHLVQTRGFELIILRVSNPYGSMVSKPDQGVIPILINAFLTGQTFRIIGDGEAVRDYIEVGALCRAVERAVRVGVGGRELVLNIGSGQATSLNRLIEILSGFLERPLATTSIVSENDVQSNVLDCTRARAVLDWRLEVPLEVGLTRFLEKLGVYNKR